MANNYSSIYSGEQIDAAVAYYLSSSSRAESAYSYSNTIYCKVSSTASSPSAPFDGVFPKDMPTFPFSGTDGNLWYDAPNSSGTSDVWYQCVIILNSQTKQVTDQGVVLNTKGDKGATGAKGDQGETGAQGATGATGPKGDDGTSVTILGTYDTYEELIAAHPSGNNNGDGYLVGGDLYVWDGTQFIDVGTIKGANGQSVFTSYMFKRSSVIPTEILTDEGSFEDPSPSNTVGWSDGIPSGYNPVYMQSRIFSSDGKTPQQDSWSSPKLMADTTDLDIEYCHKEAYTNPPSGHPNTNTEWDNNGTGAIWVAVCKKVGGSWSNWVPTKIKGETGATPTVTIGSNGNWYINGVDSGKTSKGDDGNSPYINTTTNTWWEYDADKGKYVNTNIPAKGTSSFILDIDNEMTSVSVSSTGITTSEVVITFNLKALYGLDDVTSECTLSSTEGPSGIAVDLSNKSVPKITIPKNTPLPELLEITITAVHADYGTRTATFSLASVKSGGQGEDAVIQELLPGLSQISFSRGTDGVTLTPSSRYFACTVKKTKGAISSVQTIASSGLTVVYSYDAMPTSSSEGEVLTDEGMTVPNTIGKTDLYVAAFNSAGTLVDREVIPIVTSGAKGDQGDKGTSVIAQFSPDKIVIHDTYQDGDLWMQTSSDGGLNYTAWLRIVGEQGEAGSGGAYTDYKFGISADLTTEDVLISPKVFADTWYDAPQQVSSAYPYLWQKEQKMVWDDTTGDYTADGYPHYIRITGEPSVNYTLSPSMSAISFVRDTNDKLTPEYVDLYVDYIENFGGTITTYSGQVLENLSVPALKIGGTAPYNMLLRGQNADGTWGNWYWVKDLKNYGVGIYRVLRETSYVAIEYIHTSANAINDISDANIVNRVTIIIQKEASKGDIGLTGAMPRIRGIYSSTGLYYNNGTYRDVVMIANTTSTTGYDYYIVAEDKEEVTGQDPTSTTGYWESFGDYKNIATSVLLAQKGYIDVIGTGSMFIGQTGAGVTHNSNGTTSYATITDGWVITSGSIKHINQGTTQLELSSDGCIKDPNGLHFKVAGNTLKDAGIDIVNKQITLTSDNLVCKNTDDEKTMWLDSHGNLTTAGCIVNQVQTIDMVNNVNTHLILSGGQVKVPTGTYDIAYSLDVLQCANCLKIVKDTTSNNIYLPYFLMASDSSSVSNHTYLYCRTKTAFRTGTSHSITSDELKALLGKKIYLFIEGDSSKQGYLYTSPSMIQSTDTTITSLRLEILQGDNIVSGWSSNCNAIHLNTSGSYVLEFTCGKVQSTSQMIYYWKVSTMSLPDVDWD